MSDLARRIREWTFAEALPFWLAQGVDAAHGGFVEALDFTGADAGMAFKRTRVSCRQIYVFSHAALLGWGDGLNAAADGARHLAAVAWRGDGFVRRLSRDGRPLDQTVDLYDNAFALFAFAWLFRATGDDWALTWARRTLGAIRDKLRHPSIGYWHDETHAGFRLQNPHMHLIEASLAAFEASGEEEFLNEARTIAHLFGKRFFDGRTLGEFFDNEFMRAPAPEGAIVEPGHMLEWAWILAQYARLTGEDKRAPITALIDFAEAHGVDVATGRVFNAVREDGAVIDGGSRTWPNTERLKAAIAAHEALGRNASSAAAAATNALFQDYLVAPFKGGWQDHFDAGGAMIAPNVPASTLYHVFLAFAEALRAPDVFQPSGG